MSIFKINSDELEIPDCNIKIVNDRIINIIPGEGYNIEKYWKAKDVGMKSCILFHKGVLYKCHLDGISYGINGIKGSNIEPNFITLIIKDKSNLFSS